MRGLKKAVCVAAAVAVVLTGLSRAEGAPGQDDDEQAIDLAICLDTSGSMSGLINSAREKLWQIVSELATARPAPRLRVALLTYGSPAYGAGSGWVRVNLDLTDDLDRVNEELFALRTSGGTEYVARVTKRAVDSLSWSTERDAYRVIFVAGNESADQDMVYRNADVCRAAASRDIVVNAIYCGSDSSGDAAGYRRVARLADGQYASIDQNRRPVVVSTPYDDDLSRLSRELNTTYVAYGAQGAAGEENQKKQDKNAASMSPSVAAERASAKASSVYLNKGWDLVDASKDKEFKLEEVADAALPAEMRKLSRDEQRAYVEEKAKRRAEINERIAELSAERKKHVAEEMAKRPEAERDSFGRAVREAVRTQAAARGFEFEE